MSPIPSRVISGGGATALPALLIALLTCAPRCTQHDGPAILAAQSSGARVQVAGMPASNNPAASSSAQCLSWRGYPLPTGYDVAAVAAISATDVWAVGGLADASNQQQPLIMHWDGTRWKVVPGGPVTAGGTLVAVAAISPTDVWAVGRGDHGYFGTALIEHWNGSAWSVVSGAVPSQYSLSGVAGLAADDVWIVGTKFGALGTLIEHWDGRGWRVVPGAPLGRYGGTLNAVTALSRDNAWAVGEDTGDFHTALIEHWDGRRWRVAKSPDIYDHYNGGLNSITAISADDLWAVGHYADVDNIGGALVEHWDGRRWTIGPSPDAAFTFLLAVAAVSAHDVWAAGFTNIEHWDGSAWSDAPSLGGARGLSALSGGDVWSVTTNFIAHHSGPPCKAVRFHTPTIGGLSGVGLSVDNDHNTYDDPPGALVVDGRTGRAFVSNQQTVSVLDLARRSVQRTVKAGGTLTLDERGGRVYVARGYNSAARASVVVLNAANGDVLATLAGGPHAIQVAVDHRAGRLFVLNGGDPMSGMGGGVTVVAATTGARLRALSIHYPVDAVVDERTGRVFVSGADGVTTLDANTGAILQRYPISYYIPMASPTLPSAVIAIDDRAGYVYVGLTDYTSSEATLRLLDASSSALQRSYRWKGVIQAMSVDHGTGNLVIYDGGNVRVVDPTSGATVSSMVTDSREIALAVNGQTGRNYVPAAGAYTDPLSSGEVQVFDEATGTLLARVAVPPGPDELAVDDRSGQVVVLHQGGVTLIPPSAGDTVAVRSPEPAARTCR